jgi:dihydroorotase
VRFDLVITGGHVIDPDAGLDGRADVGVRRGRIAAVDTSIPGDAGFEHFDASGLYVTPGLVDLHTHTYHGATFFGIDAELIAARTGVTTWVDAGSAGAYNFQGFRDFVITPSFLRMYAFINISAIGLTGHDFELTNLAYCEPVPFNMVIDRNRDIIVGAKVRLGVSTVGEHGYKGLEIARAAVDVAELPIMLHIADAPPDPADFGHLLQEGDVVTHCFTGNSMKLVDDDGEIREFARRWLDGGVLLDMGHGTGSFSYRTAEAMLAAGVLPAFISSDLHVNSLRGPAYSLPTCMNKFLALGVSLFDVVDRATNRPARFLGLEREIGTLREGAHADIAVFDLVENDVKLYDASWEHRLGTNSLSPVATFLDGRPLPVRELPAPPAYFTWRRGGRDDVLHANQADARGEGSTPFDLPDEGGVPHYEPAV